MTRALISIDYTKDFVADDGKLTAGKPAQAIEEAIARITKEAYEAGDYIFFAIDGHDEGDVFHPETKLFPPHNIKGTDGRDLYGQSKKTAVSFGWTNAIILPFLGRIWIFVCANAGLKPLL